jgi:hypothetical protein
MFSNNFFPCVTNIDDTISETERANRIFDIINSTKSSYSIAVLYIALLDSSIEGDEGAPTHHQLACEMKRLVKEITSQFTPEEPQGNFKTESSTEILELIIDDLQDIQITDHQKHTFINRLGLPNDVAVSTNQLNQVTAVSLLLVCNVICHIDIACVVEEKRIMVHYCGCS